MKDDFDLLLKYDRPVAISGGSSLARVIIVLIIVNLIIVNLDLYCKLRKANNR